jgi:acetyltransferase-like isoleucine patch superfamily enzyme
MIKHEMPVKLKSKRGLVDNLNLYFYVNSSSVLRYCVEQIIFLFLSWIPSMVGIALRAIVYKLIINSKGLAVIEEGVCFKRPKDIHLQSGVYIGQGCHIYGTPAGLHIGPHTRITHNAYLNVCNYSKFTVREAVPSCESKMEIGEHCVVGAFSCLMAYGHIKIGNYVTIANHCSIFGFDHVFSDIGTNIMDQGVKKGAVVIEDDVWIGANSVVLSGVTIGRGSVIGAGSVVTASIEPYSVAVGNPARIIRKRN